MTEQLSYFERMKLIKLGLLPKIEANALTKHTLKMLDIYGFYCWRQNNGGVYDPTKKVFRQNSSTPGISDIIGFHRKNGKFIAVEVKAGKDVLSPYQVNFLNQVEKSGGYSFVVRNLEDIETIANLFRQPPLTDTVKKLKS